MKTITIAAGITLTATEATIAAYEAECKAIADAEFFERQLDEVLAEARESNDPTVWGVYSDLYKDLYGIRPRWMFPDPASYWQEVECLAKTSGLS